MNSICLFYLKQCKRELLIQIRKSHYTVNFCLFFLIILFMFPLSLKPEANLLRTIAPGVVWMAILFSLFLSAEHLFQQDYEHGVIEQWLVSGVSLPLLISAKVLAHWLFNLVPLVCLSPLVALLFSLSVKETGILVLTLICGTPALLFLCALVAALGVGINQKNVLMALILLPLSLPVLIFGSGALTIASSGLPISAYVALLLAMSFFAAGLLPFVITGVIRICHVE